MLKGTAQKTTETRGTFSQNPSNKVFLKGSFTKNTETAETRSTFKGTVSKYHWNKEFF
jgi:hypothetical protein